MSTTPDPSADPSSENVDDCSNFLSFMCHNTAADTAFNYVSTVLLISLLIAVVLWCYLARSKHKSEWGGWRAERLRQGGQNPVAHDIELAQPPHRPDQAHMRHRCDGWESSGRESADTLPRYEELPAYKSEHSAREQLAGEREIGVAK